MRLGILRGGKKISGFRKGFICLGTSRLLGVGVVVSEVLRESAGGILWPLLVSSSSHEWEEQLDEEPEDKSSLINRTGVKNSANVAPKLNRSSRGRSYEREEKRRSGGSIASVCVRLNMMSKAEGRKGTLWALRNRDGLLFLGIESEGRQTMGVGTQRQNR